MVRRSARHALATALLAAATAACQSTHDPMVLRVNEGPDLTALTAGAGTDALLVRTDGTRPYICDTPPPDAAIDEFADSAISLSLVSISDSGSGDSGDGIGEAGLGGRSANVLITREVLYRFCEFAGNTDLTSDERIALCQATLDAMVSINQTDLGGGSTNTSASSIAASSALTETSDTGTDTDSAAGQATSDGDDG